MPLWKIVMPKTQWKDSGARPGCICTMSAPRVPGTPFAQPTFAGHSLALCYTGRSQGFSWLSTPQLSPSLGNQLSPSPLLARSRPDKDSTACPEELARECRDLGTTRSCMSPPGASHQGPPEGSRAGDRRGRPNPGDTGGGLKLGLPRANLAPVSQHDGFCRSQSEPAVCPGHEHAAAWEGCVSHCRLHSTIWKKLD